MIDLQQLTRRFAIVAAVGLVVAGAVLTMGIRTCVAPARAPEPAGHVDGAASATPTAMER